MPASARVMASAVCFVMASYFQDVVEWAGRAAVNGLFQIVNAVVFQRSLNQPTAVVVQLGALLIHDLLPVGVNLHDVGRSTVVRNVFFSIF